MSSVAVLDRGHIFQFGFWDFNISAQMDKWLGYQEALTSREESVEKCFVEMETCYLRK